jgi:2-hydroxychromene-2-carboxylate isomerase
MAAPIDFYFDFSSPYGYFAATRISALAAKYGRGVVWRPLLLGVVFKVTGSGPLPSLPLKGPYSTRDMARTARFLGIQFKLPDPFPVSTQETGAGRVLGWNSRRLRTRSSSAVLALYRAISSTGGTSRAGDDRRRSRDFGP